jgi:ketosteroid isomerase-like protein
MLRACESGEMTAMVTRTGVRRRAAIALLLGLAAPCAALATDYDDLVAAERAFAADAGARSTRDAFLAALADDGVVFAPGPASGKAVWTARAADTAKLEWAPEAAEIAASGDLGYTYGPWRLTPPGADKPAHYGHYFTVWRKQADGHWKALVDKGVVHAEVPFPTTVQRRGQLALAPAAAAGWPAHLLADLRHADLLAAGRITPDVAAADIVRLRHGALPDATTRAEAFDAQPAARVDSGAVISAAGDLAATWGGGAQGGNWLRVWRRAGTGDPTGQTWRLAADVSDNVLPPAPKDE